jgi:branched-chain amino acid transport system ATP-binding protein
MALLQLAKVSRFFGGLAAIRALDMEVNEGEIVGLIGPNGAGKTTTFNVITGELGLNEGRIIFKGRDISGLSPNHIAKLGIVRTFQLVTLFPGYTVLENLLVGFHLQSNISFLEAMLNTRSNRHKELSLYERAMEVSEFMGLTRFVDQLAENLPHGLQRKLGVGIALAANPKILLLDEPLTGMNAQEASEMIEAIREIRNRYRISVVVVEHNMKAVMALCERIIVISFGEKIAEGMPEEIKENKKVIEAYLGGESDAP